MTNSSDELRVGIDLGTSRSSISASNGQHHMVESFVGWPVDMVARKVLKKSILFGADALENRTMLDLHRPLERGLLKEGSQKDVEAVRELIRHLLSLAGATPEARQKGMKVRAVIGVPAESLRTNKQYLRNAMTDIVDSLMIVSEPFSVAYGLDALLHTMIIDIGAGTADFCVMKGRYPTEEDQRTLPSAGDHVDAQLLKLVQTRYPDAAITVHMARLWKEQHSFVGTPERPVMVNAPVAGKPTDLDITAEMRAACESILAPVAETMIDLIGRIEPEYQERVRNNVILSGGTGLIGKFDVALTKALTDVGGGKVTVVPDPIYVGADGGLNLAVDAPDSDWEKLS